MASENRPSEPVLPSAFEDPEESLTVASAIGAPLASRSTPPHATCATVCPAATVDAARTMRAKEQKYFRLTPQTAKAALKERFGFTGLPYVCNTVPSGASFRISPRQKHPRIISLNHLLKPFCSGVHKLCPETPRGENSATSRHLKGIEEQAFRFNTRATKDNKLTHADRFALLIIGCRKGAKICATDGQGHRLNTPP